MIKLIQNSLYKKDLRRFRELQDEVQTFNLLHNGNNIIQDDIFRVMTNYANKNGIRLETMHLPLGDDDVCAFTTIREGIIFVVINSRLPLSKQVFAAAHELYHVVCCVKTGAEENIGSMLTAEEMDESAANSEDREANAFAAMLLVPSAALQEQVNILRIKKADPKVDELLKLIDVFGIPYKALVMRLVEEDYISEDTAIRLGDISATELEKVSLWKNIAARWLVKKTETFDFAGLEGMIHEYEELELMPESRLAEDQRRLKALQDIMLSTQGEE